MQTKVRSAFISTMNAWIESANAAAQRALAYEDSQRVLTSLGSRYDRFRSLPVANLWFYHTGISLFIDKQLNASPKLTRWIVQVKLMDTNRVECRKERRRQVNKSRLREIDQSIITWISTWSCGRAARGRVRVVLESRTAFSRRRRASPGPAAPILRAILGEISRNTIVGESIYREGQRKQFSKNYRTVQVKICWHKNGPVHMKGWKSEGTTLLGRQG